MRMKTIKFPGADLTFYDDGSIQPHDYMGWIGPRIPLIAGIGFILRMGDKYRMSAVKELMKYWKGQNLLELSNLNGKSACYWLTGGNGVHFGINGEMGSTGMSDYEVENLNNELVYEGNQKHAMFPPGYDFCLWGHSGDLAVREADKIMSEVEDLVNQWINAQDSISIKDAIRQVRDWYEDETIPHTYDQFYELIECPGYEKYHVEVTDKLNKNKILLRFISSWPSFENDSFKEEFKEAFEDKEIEGHEELVKWFNYVAEPHNIPFVNGELVRNIETGELVTVEKIEVLRGGIPFVFTDKDNGFVLQYERVRNESRTTCD